MKQSKFDSLVNQIVSDFADGQKSQSKFLILTIFGDFINAHGGVIWLGSMIKMVEKFGINHRLVRTSFFRLTEKNILQSNQLGRRSFYQLTEKGSRQFLTAAERIYRYHRISWDKEWRLVISTIKDIPKKRKDKFHKELVWLGFNRLSSGVYAHPIVNTDQVLSIVDEMQLADSVVVMQATSIGGSPLKSSTNMIKYCFNFDAMKKENEDFIALFNPVLEAAENADSMSDECCFLIRVLLVHKYRLILLGEPELPHELIPENCLSHQVRDITEKLYKLIFQQAENFFLEVAEGEVGQLPKASEEFYSRFGGLNKV